MLALNEATFPGFCRRDLRFFGIHDARNDAMARFDDPEYYTGKPRADLRKTVLCTSLSVLAKSAAAQCEKCCLSTRCDKSVPRPRGE